MFSVWGLFFLLFCIVRKFISTLCFNEGLVISFGSDELVTSSFLSLLTVRLNYISEILILYHYFYLYYYYIIKGCLKRGSSIYSRDIHKQPTVHTHHQPLSPMSSFNVYLWRDNQTEPLRRTFILNLNEDLSN